MKLNKKIIALLLVVSIVLSIAMPISLTNASAITGTGMKASLYRMPKSYEGIIGDVTGNTDSGASTSYENNKGFAGSIDKLLAASTLKSETDLSAFPTVSAVGDYYIRKWTGTMTAKQTGDCLIVGRKIDNGFAMIVDGQLVYEYWGASHWFDGDNDRLPSDLGSFSITTGEQYNVEMYFMELNGEDVLAIEASLGDGSTSQSMDSMFSFELHEEFYKKEYQNFRDKDTLNSFLTIGKGGEDGSSAGGNNSQCIAGNDRYTETIDELRETATDFGGSEIVSTFGDAVINEDYYLIEYEGYIVPKETATYTFGAFKVDNCFYLEIDGRAAYEFWAGEIWNDTTGNIYSTYGTLEAGKKYEFTAYFLEIEGGQPLEIFASKDNGTTRTAINDLFYFYPSEEAKLGFNLRAVNLLSGATTINSSSILTVQYTDATLGDGIEMYAKLTKTDGTVLVEKEPVGSGFLRVVPTQVYGSTGEVTSSSTAGTATTQDIYSNTTGSVTFSFSSLGSATYNVAGLEVTVWIEKSSESCSNKATTAINNGFTSSAPSGLSGSNWMNYIDGATLLPQINIPGSHDSGSRYFSTGKNSWNMTEKTNYPYKNRDGNRYSLSDGVTMYTTAHDYNVCQTDDILTQLNYGVRYLDIRCDTVDGWDTSAKTSEGDIITNFAISHGLYEAYVDSGCTQLLTFLQVYEWCKEFLEANPSETIVMALNDEKCVNRSELIGAVQTFVKADPDLFYTKSNEIPTLDDVRGKIVLLRRYPYKDGSGTYVDDDNDFMEFYWIDGDDHESSYDIKIPHSIITPSNASVGVATYYVQDMYGLSTTDKWSKATSFATQAAGNKKANEYYVNFFSTANNQKPSATSSTINNNFIGDSYQLTSGAQYGYMLFDFITADICAKVYNTNIFTTTAQSSATNNESADEKVVHYDFADVALNTIDDLEDNGFDGTLVNLDLLEVNSIYNTITFNNSGKTSTNAGHISIPQGVFRGTGNTATIQVWMKDNSDRNTALLSLGSSQNNYFTSLTQGWSSSIDYALKPQKVGSETSVQGTSRYELNKWHLVTYILAGGEMKIYIDDNDTAIASGTLNANFSDVDGSVFNDTSLLLGATNLSINPGFSGSIGDFSIYNYAVSTNEIAATYSALADEYTYVTKVTLNDSQEIFASETPADAYIDEGKQEKDSTIWINLPAGADLGSVKLNLEYDSSATATISIDGSTSTFINGSTYDLSGNVVLTLRSIDDTSSYVKTYNVKVNGIVEKDWKTGEFKDILPQGSVGTQTKDDTHLYTGWYTAQGSNTPNQTPQTGDVVYDRTVEITNPVLVASSVRTADPVNGLTKGIRFQGSISRNDFYNYLYGDKNYEYADNLDLKFGMLLLPEQLLGTGNVLTVDTTSVLNIEGKNVYSYGESGGNMTFTGLLVNLTETFCDVDLVARAYIKYTYNGEEYYIYSEQCNPVSYNDVLAQVQ